MVPVPAAAAVNSPDPVELDGEQVSTDCPDRGRSRFLFADPPCTIPELAAVNAAAAPKKKDEKKNASSGKIKTNGPIAQSVELRTFNP